MCSYLIYLPEQSRKICLINYICSRHGFLYIRGWMQMVIAPNDLFSWNNRYNKYNVTNIFTYFLLGLCTWTHSVHARVLKPLRGSLPWLPAISSFCHVFPLPLSGLNWGSLSPLGGPGPSPSKMAPLFTGSAHTPLPGSGTIFKWIYWCNNVFCIDWLADDIDYLWLTLILVRPYILLYLL